MFTVKLTEAERMKGLHLFKNISCLRLRKQCLKSQKSNGVFKNISCLRLSHLVDLSFLLSSHLKTFHVYG